MNYAILSAKVDKAARLKNIEYNRRLREAEKKQRPTSKLMFRMIVNKAKKNFRGFVIDDHNRELLRFLFDYFCTPISDSEEIALKQEAWFSEKYPGKSLYKGILIQGNVGSGKTSMMNLFNKNIHQSFIMLSCREIAAQYAEKGTPVIKMYSRPISCDHKENFGQNELGICYDDMGAEKNMKYFGNEANVMEEIMQNVYDKPEMRRKIYITTNLTADDLNNDYGIRVVSRMREMFNVIILPETAPDRRK